jgi:D-alanyl-D-alanine carboxypeptidase (penicillin-binding protein 5/6)
MTDSNSMMNRPPKDPREATEEETQQERALRYKKQKRQKLRRAILIVLAALLLAAAVYALAPVVLRLITPPAAQPVQSSQTSQTSQSSQPAQSVQPEKSAQSSAAASSSAEQPASPSQPASSSASSAQTSSDTRTVPAQTGTTEDPAAAAGGTQTLDLQMYSKNAILIDLTTDEVIAEKKPDDKIYPASMTKVLTALVAADHIPNWDDTFTMTQAIIDPLYKAGASMAGFEAGETVTLRELLYGTLLPSGAEAAEGLAVYVAGSEKDFVKLMNEKAQELGLTKSHFMNVSGLHDDNHYSTVREMAVILKAALQDPECRAALSCTTHTTAPTTQHPKGLTLTDKFLYRVASQDKKGCEILGAKTGFTKEAGNCCASYGTSPAGRECICVTAQAWTGQYAIDDHIAMYATYADK